MRPVTIRQAADHYAGTGLTYCAIRRAVLSGEIRHVRAGKKYLLTIEACDAWLWGEGERPKIDSPISPGAVRVNE